MVPDFQNVSRECGDSRNGRRGDADAAPARHARGKIGGRDMVAMMDLDEE
jgi:hypothetical protein